MGAVAVRRGGRVGQLVDGGRPDPTRETIGLWHGARRSVAKIRQQLLGELDAQPPDVHGLYRSELLTLGERVRVELPGDELLGKICEDAGHLPIVAEDLGIITPEVTALRKKYHLPGMSVLQFGFDEHEDNPHKPQNIKQDSVVYTGTHDNDTTKGWFNGFDDDVKKYILQTLKIYDTERHAGQIQESNADLVVDKLIDIAMNSQASLCIIPMQDCLHLGSEARMNTPGTVDENWQWSFGWEQIHDDMAADLRLRIETAKRSIK